MFLLAEVNRDSASNPEYLRLKILSLWLSYLLSYWFNSAFPLVIFTYPARSEDLYSEEQYDKEELSTEKQGKIYRLA